MGMPGREYSAEGKYRYGFNGQENQMKFPQILQLRYFGSMTVE
jgi:hypothetical protein